LVARPLRDAVAALITGSSGVDLVWYVGEETPEWAARLHNRN